MKLIVSLWKRNEEIIYTFFLMRRKCVVGYAVPSFPLSIFIFGDRIFVYQTVFCKSGFARATKSKMAINDCTIKAPSRGSEPSIILFSFWPRLSYTFWYF